MSDLEKEAFIEAEDWLLEVEKTGMAKSYKMVVLKYMLSRGADSWLDSVIPEEVASFFHQYLTGKEYRRRIDFSDKAAKQMWEYDEKKFARLITTMPMTKWSGSSKDMVTFKDNMFLVRKKVANVVNEHIYKWTSEISDYRLHVHFERKQNNK